MAKGKWCAMANIIGGKMKYIAGRILNEDEPLHSGNIEHFGEYTEDEAAVCEIAEILNKAEQAKANPNTKKEEAKEVPSDEERSERPRGYRVLIEDLDSGEVTAFDETVCVIGVIASMSEKTNEDEDGEPHIVLSKIAKSRCGSVLVAKVITECKSLLQDIREEIIESLCPGLTSKVENLVDEMLNKYRGGDEE
jgi:hypothetical protein